ncbi:MAG: carbohydrate ABC transporter permease [Oscillospiraceae bacterium]
MKKRKANLVNDGSLLGNICIFIVAVLVCIISLYPMYYVFILSISSPQAVLAMNRFLLPDGLYLDSYKIIFKNADMWHAYGNTIGYVVVTTVLMVCTCVMVAYPLTSNRLIGKKYVSIFLLIPMYFSGGLIPTFLLMTKLNLYNNIWAIIIPGAFNIWNIILTRTYFTSIPESLREAAKIDGANNFKIMWKIYLPIAKPIIAVICIYTIVNTWNSWFSAMVYLPDVKLQPLQLFLRRVLIEQTVDLASTNGMTMKEAEAMALKNLANIQLKYAMIVFTTLPVIFAYPFFQKHFVKGVMVGSLKG